ncbi:lipid droplet-associated protein [Actinophytocola gossypii]|uniref:Lipid droplet-associated protein n=1 Tax=Actinophytocola gossypii TaxID=2812003 RepID=A0ABT2JHU0_9PSEU|nr:lipid droplet-associated protein [Actinophytocola gossypii]MCT2587452.1 lipid droplet-associated protein [Actinophytocola gossypii]
MKSIPLPVRVAAGLAVTAVEQARTLPAKLAGLPVTVVSQALQASMRVQQQVTELAIRGDEVLAGLRPVEETPEWATFDEDLDDDTEPAPRPDTAQRQSAFDQVVEDVDDVDDVPDRRNGFRDPLADTDPWAAEERALTEETENHEPDLPTAVGYDQLSLPQLRARLRRFSIDELTELLAHERAHGNRPSFVGMLTRRIANLRDTSD